MAVAAANGKGRIRAGRVVELARLVASLARTRVTSARAHIARCGLEAMVCRRACHGVAAAAGAGGCSYQLAAASPRGRAQPSAGVGRCVAVLSVSAQQLTTKMVPYYANSATLLMAYGDSNLLERLQPDGARAI